MSATPTRKQYEYLLRLGSGSALVVGKKRETDMYLNRGWVTGEQREDNGRPYYVWVRITPEGLRALALAVSQYGLGEIGPKPMTERRVCADCGSTRYRIETVEAVAP